MKIRHLKIGTRLGLGFGTILLIIIAIAILNLSGMSKIQKAFDDSIKVTEAKTEALNDLRQVIMEAIVLTRNIALLTDVGAIEKESQKLSEARNEYGRLFERLERLVTPDEKVLLDRISATRVAAVQAQQRAAALSQASQASKGTQTEQSIQMTINEVQPLQHKTLDAIGELLSFMKKNTVLANQQAEQTLAASRVVTFSLACIAVLFGGLIGWGVTHSITRPLDQAVGLACRVADGDLTTLVAVESRDETGKLMQTLKNMNGRLAGIVGQVRSSTDNIASASDQIAAGNLDLSSRTLSQAGSLEETAAAMEELTSTVKKNAENAQQASEMVTSTSAVAIKGGQMVAQMVNTMGSINASSSKISEIIGVIDGIAFQTNILALNAAVEAARAGEQGRGFAVVAAEVRNLALRSTGAAKEIKALINDTVDKVDAGSVLVQQAGSTMEEVVSSIQRVTEIMSEIARASSEQGDGIEMINQVIAQMDEATQQNSALVEEVAAAAESLQHQAKALAQLVSVFIVDVAPVAVPAGQGHPGLVRQEPKAMAMRLANAAPHYLA